MHCSYPNVSTKSSLYLGMVMVGARNVSDIIIHPKKLF
jgi:hypothetical protein